MEIKLTLTTKLDAVIQDLTLKCNSVPQINEVIELNDKQYLVTEIKYKLNQQNILTAHLRCRDYHE